MEMPLPRGSLFQGSPPFLPHLPNPPSPPSSWEEVEPGVGEVRVGSFWASLKGHC